MPPEVARLPISGVATDSRKVEPGNLFAALAGTATDGALYVSKAIDAGAAAVLTSNEAQLEEVSVPVLRVAEPRATLARMAARYYPRQPDVIGAVTGTSGKTSVASFLRQIWSACGHRAAFIGTTGVIASGMRTKGNLTTPDPVELHRLLDGLAGDGITHAAMEASSHGLDQHRLVGVRLSVAGFTNLGRDHMDYHDGPEDYFAAKMRLFADVLPAGSPAVIFADDVYSDRAIEVARAASHEVLSVGRAGAALALKRVEHERFRQVAEIAVGANHHRVEFPLAGDFQLSNALVAAGMAIATGCDEAQVMAALEKLEGAPGRLDLVGRTAHGAPAYVDYAHKPEALENVLNSLRPFTAGRLIVVFGCGGDRDAGKRPVMGEIAARLADIAIVTDDNPRSEEPATVRAQILAAAPGALEIGDRAEAIRHGVTLLAEGDCLVVAGKGHETGQTIGEEELPFSDHEVTRAALGALAA